MKQYLLMKTCTVGITFGVTVTLSVGLGLGSPALAGDSVEQVQSIGVTAPHPALADEAKKLQLEQAGGPIVHTPGQSTHVHGLGIGGRDMQAAQPSNDLCENAIPLECDSKTFGSTLEANFSDAGFCGTSHSSAEVWYTITGTGDEITVDTCNEESDYDTKLTVWTGSCTALQCVSGNDDASCEFGGLLSRVTFDSVEGQTYYVMVHGFSTGIGNFGLNVECAEPPTPETCPDLTGDKIVGPADLVYLLDQWGPCDDPEDCPADLNGDGMVNWHDLLELLANWDCFTGDPPCGDPDAGDCCSANGTPNCDDEACCEAVCADDPFCCDTEWDGICAETANSICDVCQTAANDTCQTAIPLECDVKELGSTLNATFSSAGTCGTSHTAPDVWYTVTGTGGLIEVNTCNPDSDYDTKLTVWTGSCGQLECVGGNDDAACEFGGLLSRVTFNSVEGQTYYIMVHGFSSGVGNFGLNVLCPDPPDPFECPDGSSDEGEPCGDDTNGGCNMDVPQFTSVSCGETICGSAWAAGGTRDTDWYEIVVTEAAEFTWSATAQFPFVIGLVDTGGSGSCADATALDPFATGAPDTTQSVSVTLEPGTYWFFIADQGFEGNPCGSGFNGYTVTLECDEPGGFCGDGVCDPEEDCLSCPEDCGECEVPENNTCADAMPIFVGDTGFSTIGATTDGPADASCQFDGQTYNDIYFSFVAPSTGTISISTCSQADYDTDLKFYASCDMMNELLACNDDFPGCSGFTSFIEAVDVVEGEEYILRVGGWNAGIFGTGTVTIQYE